jgi:hypothetical protein
MQTAVESSSDISDMKMKVQALTIGVRSAALRQTEEMQALSDIMKLQQAHIGQILQKLNA